MKRTQVQLPDPLYEEVKRVARARDWSITEVLRQGAEYMIRVYPADKQRHDGWEPPRARHLGTFLTPPDQWRELANER